MWRNLSERYGHLSAFKTMPVPGEEFSECTRKNGDITWETFCTPPCNSQSCLGSSLWVDWEQSIMSDGEGFWGKGSRKLLYNDWEVMLLWKLCYLSFVSRCFDIVKCLGQVPLSKLHMIKINHLIYQFNALLFTLPCLGCKDKDILLIIGRENKQHGL